MKMTINTKHGEKDVPNVIASPLVYGVFGIFMVGVYTITKKTVELVLD